jgi:hypothetical protein
VLDDPSLPLSGHGNDWCTDLTIEAFGNEIDLLMKSDRPSVFAFGQDYRESFAESSILMTCDEAQVGALEAENSDLFWRTRLRVAEECSGLKKYHQLRLVEFWDVGFDVNDRVKVLTSSWL